MPEEKQFRVIYLTDDLEENPECRSDNEEFPHLLDRIEDECVQLVIDERGEDYPASEFFNMVIVKRFTATIIQD